MCQQEVSITLHLKGLSHKHTDVESRMQAIVCSTCLAIWGMLQHFCCGIRRFPYIMHEKDIRKPGLMKPEQLPAWFGVHMIVSA